MLSNRCRRESCFAYPSAEGCPLWLQCGRRTPRVRQQNVGSWSLLCARTAQRWSKAKVDSAGEFLLVRQSCLFVLGRQLRSAYLDLSQAGGRLQQPCAGPTPSSSGRREETTPVSLAGRRSVGSSVSQKKMSGGGISRGGEGDSAHVNVVSVQRTGKLTWFQPRRTQL